VFVENQNPTFCVAKPHFALQNQPSAVLWPSALCRGGSQKRNGFAYLFGGKRQRNPMHGLGFTLGLHGLKPGFAWLQTQDKPAKMGVYFLTPLFI
jgi:hypothetical protein